MLARLREHWTHIQHELLAKVDEQYGVYEGCTFSLERFAPYLVGNDIARPTLVSGSLDWCDNTFRHMARAYPPLAPLRELRYRCAAERTLSVQLTTALLREFGVGRDAKARALQPLELVRLMSVAKTPGRNPRVTVLELPE
jgi:hypothetical protein